MMSLAVIILTKDESIHIQRALDSVAPFADLVYVVDSGSVDDTVKIAENFGAKVKHRNWVNYATQFNWALEQLPHSIDLVLRLDADEYVSDILRDEIRSVKSKADPKISGYYIDRHMTFLQKPIRYGGVFPVKVLRLFLRQKGRCENRWMDEHILLDDGQTASLNGKITDNSLKSLSWWISKHNQYASREAVDLLNYELNFLPLETIADLKSGQQSTTKRWIKEHIYTKLPKGLRAWIYFMYRYIFRLGFLDGAVGTKFHILQGFWYRYLVDAKISEVKTFMKRNDATALHAIEKVLGIELDKESKSQ